MEDEKKEQDDIKSPQAETEKPLQEDNTNNKQHAKKLVENELKMQFSLTNVKIRVANAETTKAKVFEISLAIVAVLLMLSTIAFITYQFVALNFEAVKITLVDNDIVADVTRSIGLVQVIFGWTEDIPISSNGLGAVSIKLTGFNFFAFTNLLIIILGVIFLLREKRISAGICFVAAAIFIKYIPLTLSIFAENVTIFGVSMDYGEVLRDSEFALGKHTKISYIIMGIIGGLYIVFGCVVRYKKIYEETKEDARKEVGRLIIEELNKQTREYVDKLKETNILDMITKEEKQEIKEETEQ